MAKTFSGPGLATLVPSLNDEYTPILMEEPWKAEEPPVYFSAILVKNCGSAGIALGMLKIP